MLFIPFLSSGRAREPSVRAGQPHFSTAVCFYDTILGSSPHIYKYVPAFLRVRPGNFFKQCHFQSAGIDGDFVANVASHAAMIASSAAHPVAHSLQQRQIATCSSGSCCKQSRQIAVKRPHSKLDSIWRPWRLRSSHWPTYWTKATWVVWGPSLTSEPA